MIDILVDDSRTFDFIQPKWVVLHKTAGFTNVQDLGYYFQTNNLETSSHYGVGLGGEIARFVKESRGAAANCCTLPGHHADFLQDSGPDLNYNNYTISIEHIDPKDDNSTPLTPAQKQTSFELVKDICTRNNIPMRRGDAYGGILYHSDFDNVNRARCPGNYPYDELYTYLTGDTNMSNTPPKGFPDGWKDDGKTLTAPNGFKVIGGFRDYIYNNFWGNEDIPLMNETQQNPLERSNPGLKNGTYQVFRESILEVSLDKTVAKQNGIFKGWMGQELMWYITQYAKDQKTISDLNTQLHSSGSGNSNTPVVTDDIKNNVRSLVQIANTLTKEVGL